MRTKLLLLALVAALAIPMQGQNFRHSDNFKVSDKGFAYTAMREAIPEGMVRVTLNVDDPWGDGAGVWGDYSGYQMLLDADANTYGNIIPESGPLSLYYDVTDAVYGEFEYKIPEDADGSLYTDNFVVAGQLSILIPAGTYDWCITNPEYGYAIWIAANYGEINGRYDNYEFEAGNEYIFTCYMTDYGYDGVDLEIVEGQVTPPVEPTEKTGAPVFNGYTEDGIHAYFVEINETEPSTIYYMVYVWNYDTNQWDLVGEDEWLEYEEILSFVEEGKYRVEAYAIADGKLPSEQIAYEFVVAPITGIDEMVSGKTVAGVRYFNMAGQEMSEANGLTIVVTTYTDGTTNAVKVVR